MQSDNMGIRAVLWDIDGTLIDTTALIVGMLDGMFREFCGTVVPPDELRSLVGIPLEQQVLHLGDPAKFDTTIDQMSAYAIRAYERGRDRERIIPEAVNALIEIKRRGILTALVTSKNDVELANTLPRLAISAYCDIIVGADQVAPYFKPHPRPVQLALDLLDVPDPQQAVFIGDSVHDMQSGHAAGVRVGAVLWGAATETMLRAAMPNYLFSRPEEIVTTVFGGQMGEDPEAAAGAV